MHVLHWCCWNGEWFVAAAAAARNYTVLLCNFHYRDSSEKQFGFYLTGLVPHIQQPLLTSPATQTMLPLPSCRRTWLTAWTVSVESSSITSKNQRGRAVLCRAEDSQIINMRANLIVWGCAVFVSVSDSREEQQRTETWENVIVICFFFGGGSAVVSERRYSRNRGFH